MLFSEFCKEVAVIGATTGFRDAKKEFYLSSYPAAQRAIKRLLAQLASDITNVVRTGNKAAWEISEDKNKELLQQVGHNITLPKHLQERVKQGSVNALAAFEERKVNGMNLSKRVWNLVQPLQGQMELALELGLSEGKGAASLSRDVRQYLLNPDKLFRRVRGKDGILRLSKAAAAYHPGQGVYRSSYKNALRMTVTENNVAYRSADYAQWEEMPFVIGTEIGLSNNHPVVDICDELAGVYPKDFKFVGWHPFCRCFATPKLADRSEVNKWARMTDEERKGYRFKGTVDALPKQFNTWVKNNTERIAKAKTLPYFLKDNKEIIERAAKPAGVSRTLLTPEDKLRRKEIEKQAKELLRGVEMHNANFDKPITISGGKIKEWLNQPLEKYIEKNELLLTLPQIIKNSEYLGEGIDKHDPTYKMHLFEIKITNKPAWIIIRESDKGESFVHSISDLPTILNYISKRKTKN